MGTSSASAFATWKELDAEPSDTQITLAQYQAQGDFEAACALVSRVFTRTAKQVKRECEAVGMAHEAAFWQVCAWEAKRARELHQEYQTQPRSCLLAQMRKERLHLYADALQGRVSWADLVY